MNILFVHQNFPAQYSHLARHFADQPGNQVHFLTQPNANVMQGVNKIVYQPPAANNSGSHPLTLEIDASIRNGAAVAQALRELLDQGYRPDIVIGHSGWGETMFLKDVFPDAPLLANCEFFYHSEGADVGFDPEYVSLFADPARLRTRNAVNLMAMDAADWGHSATHWQRNLYPPEIRRRITAIHEGVDTDIARPFAGAEISLARDQLTLTAKDEVITFVARNLEPYRGFHIFIRALPEILRRRPRAHAVIVGGDGVSYGSPAPPGTTYRQALLQEVGDKLDLTRVHFLGQVPYSSYINLLQISSAHVYFTYPFVLSWSFIEALSCGCVVVGSATPPVLEVLEDGVNGYTVDFFAIDALADRIEQVLRQKKRMGGIREAARATAVKRYDLKRMLT